MHRYRQRAVVFLALVVTMTGCIPGADDRDMVTLTDPSWGVQFEDSTALFIGVHAVSETIAWASGTDGRVGRTTNGGQKWQVQRVPDADSLQFRDVHAFSEDVAYVLSIGAGTDSRIYKTTNGGRSWSLSFQNQDPNAFFDCFSFWDEDTGFAFSDSHDGEFTLIRTLDGGRSWNRIPPSAVPDARPGEGAFAASGTCTATGTDGRGWFVTGASGVDTRVIRTADFGETWEEAVTPIESTTATQGIFSLVMHDDSTGAIFGGDFSRTDSVYSNLAVTEDGGASWQKAGPVPLGGSVFGAASMGTDLPVPVYIAVAPTGSAWSQDGGDTWERIDSVAYWTVSFYNPRAGWAAGPGVISRFRVGGLP